MVKELSVCELAEAVEMERRCVLAVQEIAVEVGKEQTMSKYIDVEWLKQNFNTVFWSQITKTIDSAPSIDIVRCSECKYCVDAGAQRALVCDNEYIDMDIHPDDFCSYGEREGE